MVTRMPSYKDILPGAFNSLTRRVAVDRADTASYMKRAANSKEAAAHTLGSGIEGLASGLDKFGKKLDIAAEAEARKRGGGSGGGGGRGAVGSRVAYDSFDAHIWEDTNQIKGRLAKDDDATVLADGYEDEIIGTSDEAGAEWWKESIETVNYRSSIKDSINSQILKNRRDTRDLIRAQVKLRRSKVYGEEAEERQNGRLNERIVTGAMTPETALRAEYARIEEQGFSSVVSDKHKNGAALSITKSMLSTLPFDKRIEMLDRPASERGNEPSAMKAITAAQRKELSRATLQDQKTDAGLLVPRMELAIKGALQGILLKPEQKSELAARAERNNLPAVAEAYAKLRTYTAIREKFDGQTMADRNQTVIWMRQDAQKRHDTSSATQASIDAATAINAQDEKAIAESPIAFLETNQDMPVVFANAARPEEMAEALAARKANAPRLGKMIGVTVPLIKPSESQVAVERMAKGKWDWMGSVRQGAGQDAPEVYRAISQHSKTDMGFSVPFAGNLVAIHGEEAPLIQEIKLGLELTHRAKKAGEDKKSLVLKYGDSKADQVLVTERTKWLNDATGGLYQGEKGRGLSMLVNALHEYRVSENLTANSEEAYKQAAKDTAGVRTIGTDEYGGFVGLESHSKVTGVGGTAPTTFSWGLAAARTVAGNPLSALSGLAAGGIDTEQSYHSGYTPFGTVRGTIQAPSNMKTSALPGVLNSLDIDNLPGGRPLDSDGDPMSRQSFKEATYRPAGPPGRYHIYDETGQPWLAGDGTRTKVVIDIREGTPLQAQARSTNDGAFLTSRRTTEYMESYR